MGGLGRDEAVRTIRRALDLGINYLDTAPGYHDSEEVLGEALEKIMRGRAGAQAALDEAAALVQKELSK